MYVFVIDDDPLTHVMCSWSTHLFNFATWESLYSVFPVTSLDNRRMCHYMLYTPALCEQYDKYTARGFARGVVGSLWGLGEFRRRRTVVDEYTRRVPFSCAPSHAEEELRSWRFENTSGGMKLIGLFGSTDDGSDSDFEVTRS